MADSEEHGLLRQGLQELLQLKAKGLIERAEWGAINFGASEPDLERGFGIAGALAQLPVQELPRTIASQITQALGSFLNWCKEIDKFNIQGSNPTHARDNIARELSQQSTAFFQSSAIWVPYLAYKSGNISTNIELLSEASAEANRLLEQAKKNADLRAQELAAIITAAREASAAAGAAVFTGEFATEANTLNSQAKPWLAVSAGLGTMAFVLAVLIYFHAESGLDSSQLVQKTASRLAALVILFTAALWTGRVYKSLRHQALSNRHRAVSLKTLEAFVQGTASVQTKDAVLLEACRAVFGLGNTGLVDPESGVGATQIVEVASRISGTGGNQ